MVDIGWIWLVVGICLVAVIVGTVVLLIVRGVSNDSSHAASSSDQHPAFPYRRLCFAVVVIGVMTLAAGGAMVIGYLLVQPKPADAALGAVALVVSPALTVIGALSPILANLLREEKQ